MRGIITLIALSITAIATGLPLQANTIAKVLSIVDGDTINVQ